jgi:hypothetical protein
MTDAQQKSPAPAPPASLPNNSRKTLIGLALILIFIGAIFANVTFGELKKASNFETWAEAQATVVECSDERQGVFPLDTGRDYQKVTCQFSSAGRIVRSHFRSDGWKYHKGQTIEMRFDPFNTQHTMVNPSASAPAVLWYSVGFALCFIGGTGLLIYALKRVKKQSAKAQ